ncbi:MAG: phosphatase PAP2 family protein [Candidatus Microsaccharimonas sp.]
MNSKETRLLAIIFVVAGVLFALLAALVTNGVTDSLDTSVLLWINQHASPALDSLFVIITQFGGFAVVATVGLLITALLLFKKQYLKALFVVIGLGGAALWSVVFKSIVERVRPDLWESLIHETSLSFPSGHATASMALALVVIMLLWRTRWKKAALIAGTIYVLLIGFSRLYLGVHYPTDILGGWLLSITWVSLAGLAYLLVQQRNYRA